VKHCAYGHSVATLLSPHDVTTVSHKYSVTAARNATVVVAVPSIVHYPANYMKVKSKAVPLHAINTLGGEDI
jgi:hypothetical protein